MSRNRRRNRRRYYAILSSVDRREATWCVATDHEDDPAMRVRDQDGPLIIEWVQACDEPIPARLARAARAAVGAARRRES